MRQVAALVDVCRRHVRLRALASYLTGLALCLLVLGTVFDVRREAREWPFAYRGDTMFYHLIVKSVVDHGWFLDVPRLGAPDTLNLRDVPTSDNNLQVLILWLLSLGTSHYPLVLNNFFLLGFPAVFLSALAVLRHFGVTWWTGVCVSLLYAFAPFHMLRGEHHLFLSAYWQVPLAVLLALWVSGDGLRASGTSWRGSRLWLSVVICLVLSATGYYYAFFACFFLIVAGLVAALRNRSWQPMAVALGLTSLITAALFVNLMPSVRHFQDHGTASIVQRAAADADVFGLRIAQLLLPVRGHRVEAFDELKTSYARRPLINENDDVSLGMVGALGFLGLIWWFFLLKPAAGQMVQRGAAGLAHQLSIFNLAGVLLASMGAFGSLVALFGLPQVRGYNRVGVFLSFFALFAVALWVDHVAGLYGRTRARSLGLAGAVTVATVIALYDQVSPAMLPDYSRLKAQFASDAAFVQQIEQTLPRGALIFQLPFTSFPEAPNVGGVKDYDFLRGYLHSAHLRWSHGTIRGREGNAWLRHTAALPPDQLIEALTWAGFSGIYGDRNGFADGGARIHQQLIKVPGVAPLQSADGELVFYNLSAYRARLEDTTPAHDREAKRNAALYPPLAVWRDGFAQEDSPDTSRRWGASTARMMLVNRAAHAQHVRLEMAIFANPGGIVTFSSPLFGEAVRIERSRPKVERLLLLPPGRHEIIFASDAPRIAPPDDFRDIAFSVQNFKLTPVKLPQAESPPGSSDERQVLAVRATEDVVPRDGIERPTP